MVEDLEGLVDKYGGCNEVNALWQRVAGRAFFSASQIESMAAPAVEVFSLNGNPVILLGTAHTSRKSAQDAAAWVTRLEPAVLVLERCPERFADMSWPKALLMDRTAELRAVEVAGRGIMSAGELRQIKSPQKSVSEASDEEAQAIASNLWAEFELLNTERNQQVEEAAFRTWAQQESADVPKLLALGDMRESKIGIPLGEGGGGPDREALLASIAARNSYICGCIAACASCVCGPILVVLGQNHVPGVSSSLKDTLGANHILEEALTGFPKKRGLDCPAPDTARFVSSWKGALLREPAISEIAAGYAHRHSLLQQTTVDLDKLLDEYIADVEGEDLFQSFVNRGLAIELSQPSDPMPQDFLTSLSAWVYTGGEWPISFRTLADVRSSKL